MFQITGYPLETDYNILLFVRNIYAYKKDNGNP